MVPSDEDQCRQMLWTALSLPGPSAVRYPRGAGPGVTPVAAHTPVPIGKADVRRRGAKVAILAFGSMLSPALAVGDALDATVVDMRFVKPLDTALVVELARSHELVVTVEENVVQGGGGTAVAEVLAEQRIVREFLHLGLPDRFVEHGDVAQLLAACGLDAAGLRKAIESRLHR
jgi:1-deoxy-D-xylulose-5-phosphate synthase